MVYLAPVSARKIRSGHGWLGGSEQHENCYLIRITESWQGGLSGWSPTPVSSFFRMDWPGNRVAGGLCMSQVDINLG